MKTKQKRILNIKFLISSLIILGISALCSVFGLVFFADSISLAIRIIFGILLIGLTNIAVFMCGKSRGEVDYKRQIKNHTGRANSFTSLEIDYLSCVLSFVLFAVIMLTLSIVGVVFKILPIVGIVSFIYLPLALVFSFILISDSVSMLALAVYIPYTLIICASFMMGYIFEIYKIKKMRRDIANELRTFNN